jgi:hypothetical protein
VRAYKRDVARSEVGEFPADFSLHTARIGITVP